MNGQRVNNKTAKPIYLDYNATTPHYPEVVAAMRPFLEEHFGNPSSSHWYGIRIKDAVENARGQVAALLNCKPEETVFTSGGTESNNYAIRGIAFAHRDKGNHIITTRIEHPAVLEVCGYLERQGFLITYLPVDELGMVDVAEFEKSIRPQTILATIMHANNEVGTIQPLEQIASMAQKYGIIFHTDAAQSLGKISVDVKKLGVQLLSLAGHKLYAPQGIGALYVQSGTPLDKLMLGAGQEQGRRAGTENVLEIVGLGKACEIAQRDLEKDARHMKTMRDRLYKQLGSMLSEIRLNGHPEMRLSNTLSVSFRGIKANRLLGAIQDQVAVSAGAACHSGGAKISAVLKAMNVPAEWAEGTLRFSTGKMTTEKEIDGAAEIISKTVKKLSAQGEKSK